ncbi:hypothetical protein HYH61_01020 [Clostridium botulinum]|nr:hypothetical protein [Clostridium botulinum]
MRIILFNCSSESVLTIYILSPSLSAIDMELTLYSFILVSKVFPGFFILPE